MFLAGRTDDHIACANFSLDATLALHPAAARRHDQPLAEWMSVPGGAGAGLEGNQAGRNTGRICCLKQARNKRQIAITVKTVFVYQSGSLGRNRGFADSPLEEAGFEPVWGFFCQVVIFGL
jgi:hypothetical protein